MKEFSKICIIGAGGWGTALAALLANKGFDIALWTREDYLISEINENHHNSTFLPGIKIPGNVISINNLNEIKQYRLIVIAVPTQYIRPLFMASGISLEDKWIVGVTKGIERGSLLRVSEILADVAQADTERYTVLSGPSHAEEVAREMPTTVVAASFNHDFAAHVQKIFTTPTFRVYSSNDVIGCEIGGSLKNVIAIAAGVIDGLGMGDNTKAALITRGLAEISRLGIALGANPLTFSGLSGLGDLFVTCNSRHSRNRFVGEQIGKGKTLEEITGEMQMVAEGIYTTESSYQLGMKHGVEMPIAEQMFRILFEGVKPDIAIKELMSRSAKREWWW